LGARIYKQEWLGYSKQKNYAMSLASGDWILSLDADEIIPEPLIEEIRSEIVRPENEHIVGYEIPRLLFIGTTPIKHSGFYPDAQLRLIRKGAGEFNDRLVHERIEVNGPTKTLSHPILHYSYSDLDNFSQTLDKYAHLHAQERLRHGKPGAFESSFLNECFHPLWTFFLRYIMRQGYLDGEIGLKVCQIYSDYVRKKIKYLRQAIKSQQ
jgi:glycosyltransferase involved in cell wall biosynthesis